MYNKIIIIIINLTFAKLIKGKKIFLLHRKYCIKKTLFNSANSLHISNGIIILARFFTIYFWWKLHESTYL